jgi:hypothetical protein
VTHGFFEEWRQELKLEPKLPVPSARKEFPVEEFQ